ncbi:MAG: RsmE family RNA methyltransferase [Candidatus Korobacteraceae bacterium]
MTRRRWIADEFSADRAALTGEHAAHLSRTLRARIGQQFEVACGDQVRRATVSTVADDRVEFALGEEIPAGDVVPITLLLAIFKFDRMEWAIEKCTELNVTTIVPIIARRTEKHLALAAAKRLERWRRIAREAAEQSRRTAPPEITEPMRLQDALAGFADSSSKSVIPAEDFSPSGDDNSSVIPTEDFSPSGGTCCSVRRLQIVLAETEREVLLTDVLRSHTLQSVSLAIGPEGGWTEDELQSFATSQWIAASLGQTILRAETAAIAALAIARAQS